jgi:hypothetical protein
MTDNATRYSRRRHILPSSKADISKALLVLVKQNIKAGNTIEEKKRREPGVGRKEMFP